MCQTYVNTLLTNTKCVWGSQEQKIGYICKICIFYLHLTSKFFKLQQSAKYRFFLRHSLGIVATLWSTLDKQTRRTHKTCVSWQNQCCKSLLNDFFPLITDILFTLFMLLLDIFCRFRVLMRYIRNDILYRSVSHLGKVFCKLMNFCRKKVAYVCGDNSVGWTCSFG